MIKKVMLAGLITTFGYASDCPEIGLETLSNRAFNEAMELYDQCENEHFESCKMLAYVYRDIDSVKNNNRVIELYTKACNGGEFDSCRTLADEYALKKEKNITKAMKIYNEACDLGDSLSCADLERLEETINAKKNAKNAKNAKSVKKAVVPTDNLTKMLVNGVIGSYSGACDNGVLGACKVLAEYYAHGAAVTDIPKAITLYSKLCNSGSSASCNELNNLNKKLKPDIIKSKSKETNEQRELLYKECYDGKLGSCNNLAYDYQYAKGTKDVKKIIDLYSKACLGGFGIGCSNLGGIYDDGILVPKDLKRAISYYSDGCSMGSESACHYYKLRTKSKK